MIDDNYFDEGFEPDESDEAFDYDAVQEIEEGAQPAVQDIGDKAPMFQVLFAGAVAGDSILESFAEHVVGELSDRFALKAAKGGAFFQAREAEGMQNTQRFQHDQNLRAHLINGLLPVLNIARHLVAWNAPYFYAWDKEIHERLFIAGYVLHDYTKIDTVKESLTAKGFKEWDPPSEAQMPLLIEIFREWCKNLGLDTFLQPIGGAEPYLYDLIYIACNTQAQKGTARSGHLYSQFALDIDSLDLITYLSRLADLIAYIAKTPRDVIAHNTIRKVLATKLAANEDLGRPVAQLVYHHVAENRGLLLNFIHNSVTEALKNEARIPLLYAPSGVVYLERHDAPEMPDIDNLVYLIVDNIKQTVGQEAIKKNVGSQFDKDGLRVKDTFRDLFDLPDIVLNSHKLVVQIQNNAPKYMEFLENSGWPHTDNLPEYSKDKDDTRLRRMAEWASLLETQYEERLPSDINNYITFVLSEWGIHDLHPQFEELGPFQQRGIGIRYRWYWAASFALNRQAGIQPDKVLSWLQDISEKLAKQLPSDLPESSKANQATWNDLQDYIKTVLTIQSTKSSTILLKDELTNYVQAKVKRGKSICSICGSNYSTRKQLKTTVAFQPGVYTQRLRIGINENTRRLCSICATEQLLRQLFLENLETGSKAESQRIRYLSFYPAYFFSPETLTMIRRAYNQIEALRLSDSELWRHLRGQDNFKDARFWQRLENFLLRPSEGKFKRVLRYSDNAQATFFTVGFRNIDPTETESWVLPTFLAFVLSICLDVKIVVSDSSVPLVLESSELPETLWFDGLHAAIQELISVRYDPNTEHWEIEPRSNIDIDSLSFALARLTTAYLIHLDTEYTPPKENWQRFVPIANALCESPLYVFHYLKKQERDDRPLTPEKVRRYIDYAKLFTTKGDQDMSHASRLVTLYRGFYRAKNTRNANSILRPLSVVSDALLAADPRLFDFNDSEALIEVAYGELYRFMDRVGKGLADGRFPKGVSVQERQNAMREFSAYFVKEIFQKAFNKDVAALRGKQLNLLKSACEVLYRDAQYKEWEERGRDTDEVEELEQ